MDRGTGAREQVVHRWQSLRSRELSGCVALSILLFAIVLLGACSGSAAAPPTTSILPDDQGRGGSPDGTRGQLIRLQAGSFDPTERMLDTPVALRRTAAVAYEDYYVVQFRGTVLPEWRARVEALGGKLYGYMADHAYLVKLAAPEVGRVRQLPEVRWVGHYEPGFRVSPRLFAKLASAEDAEVNIMTFEPGEAVDVANDLDAGLGWVVEYGGGSSRFLRALTSGNLISRIAQLRGVAWIEEYVPPQLCNDQAAGIIHVDEVWSATGLDGAGQVVAIADTGLDLGVNDPAVIHPDFLDSAGTATRIVGTEALGRPPWWNDPSGHGTHVAGSVLGDGTQSSGLYAGVAPGASLYFQSVLDYGGYWGGIPDDLGTLFGSAYAAGARIHTNSWGSKVYGAYTTDSLSVDEYAWNHKDLTILFAAGNEGTDASPSDGVVDPDSIRSPGTAKNCITVGASENNRPSLTDVWGDDYGAPIASDREADDVGGLAAFSSRGPTDDGRIKPDLLAPGTWVISTRTGARSYDIGFESGVLSDDWQDPPAGPGWEVSDEGAGAHSGSYVLANGTPAASYAPNLSSIIFTPYLDFRTSGSSSELSLWMNYRLRDNGSDFIRVYVVGSGWQSSWTTIGQNTGGDWVLKTFPVPDNQGIVFAVLMLVTAADPVPSGYYCLYDDFAWPANATLSGVVDADYLYGSGTSMATPLTAGGVALLRQHYVDDEEITPSSALLKATLIATADDLTPGQYGTGADQEILGRPDRSQGWGRVNLKAAIDPDAPAEVLYRDVDVGLAQGESDVVSVEVTDISVPLQVALVWTDPPPATPSVTPQLVNDLDLTVTDPSSADHLPMGGTGDHFNNVETVDILVPELGTYTITVEGYDVNGPDQPYALVVYGAAAEVGLPPEISEVSPPTGAQGVMSLDISITGLHTDFVHGVSVASFSGTGITVNNTTVTDETHAVASINLDLSAPLGLRDVTVTTGEEAAFGEALFEVTVSTLSFSVDPGSWDAGAPEAEAAVTTWTETTEAESGYFEVSNEGSTAASLMIAATDTENWWLGLAPGPDTLAVGWGQTQVLGDEPSYTVITKSGVPLVSDLASDTGFGFDLQCLAPTSSTDPSEQHLTVIIGAQP